MDDEGWRVPHAHRVAPRVTNMRGGSPGTAVNDNAAPCPKEFANALERGELSVVYDPIANLASGAIAGFEVSARWFHPHHGTLSGSSLARLARAAGVAPCLPLAVLGLAARHVGRWPGYGFLMLEVDASTLARPAFADRLEAVLHGSGFAPERLLLAPIHRRCDPDDTAPECLGLCLRPADVPAIRPLLGASLSAQLDGAGKPFTMLRLDRSFASERPGPAADLQIRAAKLGRDAGLGVLGCGLDTARQVMMARIAGCTHVQGRCFGRPSPLPTAFADASAHLLTNTDAIAN